MVEYFNDTTTQLIGKQQTALELNMNTLAEFMNKFQNQNGKLEQKMVILHQLNEVDVDDYQIQTKDADSSHYHDSSRSPAGSVKNDSELQK